MLITQYEAMKRAGVSPRAIYRQKEKDIPPAYFIETKDGWMIDDAHPEWLSYLQNLDQKRNPTILNTYAKKEVERRENILFSAVYSVLKDNLDIDIDSLKNLLNKIEKRYDQNRKV